MRFLPYKQDAATKFGDTTVHERIKLLENLTPAGAELAYTDFVNVLIATPEHTPAIVRVTPIVIQPNKISLLIHYRLIGPEPAPTL
jgi:hypothetical protein